MVRATRCSERSSADAAVTLWLGLYPPFHTTVMVMRVEKSRALASFLVALLFIIIKQPSCMQAAH